MSAVASLQSELRNLGTQSKRRNTELTKSSERSLAILDAASQSFSSDPEVIRSLQKYPEFMTPLILACSEASAKSCASALQCTQNLAMYKGISSTRLHELLMALTEATQLGQGIQLKILQVLPVILHEFAAEMPGRQVVELIQVCAQLLGSNKVAVVHNAAYATLQQLITGVFDRTDAPNLSQPPEPESEMVIVDESGTVSFGTFPHLHDSCMVLLDLCEIAEKQRPSFMKIDHLSLTFTLELLELTLSNHASLIHEHEELAIILRMRVCPLLLRLFSENNEFPVVLRVVRIFYLLLRQHLSIITTESEVILSTLTQAAVQGVTWTSALCSEVLQGISLEIDLMLQIYTRFDGSEGRTNVIQTMVTDFSRALSKEDGLLLAADLTFEEYEKYAEGGVSRASSNSASNKESSGSLQQGRIYLKKSSALKVPVIDMLDRVDPPRIGKEYIYFLILRSINSIADDIHKLSANHEDMASFTRNLSNPLLLCFSVTLGAAMELDLYRGVVRSVQRLAHSSGILALYDLRDDYMLLLAQYSHLADDIESKPWILPRNTLCVRALFNLGYALGNQLRESWALITGTIGQLYQVIGAKVESTPDNLFGSSDPAFKPISVALRKLMDGTPNLSDDALIQLINALSSGIEHIYYVLLTDLGNVNAARLGDPNSGCWAAVANVLLKKVLNLDDILASQSLNETALTVMKSITEAADIHSSVEVGEDHERAQSMIVRSVCQEMGAKSLEIQISAIQHLNAILDQFGGRMNSGWEDVFSAVSPIPATNHLELMRYAFRTVELICSDFLDNLPYPCVFSLTLSLDEYARQTLDLNISFTSTSLFWSVCDHLMKGDDIGSDVDAKKVTGIDSLVDVARDDHDNSKRYALWLLALIKLAGIAGSVSQHQVRTGAIQIFLRLFNTHGQKLPAGAWTVAHELAFPTLLKSVQVAEFDSDAERDEILISIIDGTSRVYISFISEFVKLDSFSKFWDDWVKFLGEFVLVSAKVATSCHENLAKILDSANGKMLPQAPVCQFWESQSPLPTYSEAQPKATADALRAYIRLYQSIDSPSDLSKTISLVSQCSLFPYYPGPRASIRSMSPLQVDSTGLLEKLNVDGDPALASQFLETLSKMALAEYESDGSIIPMFVDLSNWSQSMLEKTIKKCYYSQAGSSSSAFPDVLAAMNKIMSIDKARSTPREVFLMVLDLSEESKSLEENDIVTGGSFILDSEFHSREEEEATIKFVSRYIDIIQKKGLSAKSWREILAIILEKSVLYERALHNLRYYQEKNFDLEAALSFGTIEAPVSLGRKGLGLYCLGLLKRLSAEPIEFAETAKEYHEARVRAVLSQYIGDCNLLGKEPSYGIVREELMAVLSQLAEDRVELNKSILDLLIRPLTKADPCVVTYIRDILAKCS